MRGFRAVLATFVLSMIVLVGTSAAAATWSPAGTLSLARTGAVAVPLHDGRVLVVGGSTQVGNGYDTKTVEIYDPATNSWSVTGSLADGRTEHVATALADGRVLVTGGENANICTSDQTTEIYDPSSGTWSFSGNIGLARAGATATLLGNGKVLLAGGGNRCGSVYSSAELYDPATGTWSPTGSMATARQYASAVLLSDGRVLVVGGVGVSPFAALSSAEIYNPATGTWSTTGSMATTRHDPSLVRLADGRVMAAGGFSGAYYGSGYYLNGPSVEIWDPNTGLWSATGDMNTARAENSLSMLPDGTVLAAGGFDSYNSSASTITSTAELWDPSTGTWAYTSSLATGRAGHTATVLASGNVVVAGGDVGGGGLTASAELYGPADTTPPADAPAATGALGNNGWYTSDVSVAWNWTDSESGIDTSHCVQSSVSSGEGTAIGVSSTCQDLAGNQASDSLVFKIDKTAPVVSYTGNAGSYTVDQQVSITCSAVDPNGANGSGIATGTCANVAGLAADFGLGTHTFGAAATDNAGNTGSASTSFAVTVNPASLCKLTRQLVDGSSKYSTLTAKQKATVDNTINALCTADLTPIKPGIKPAMKAVLIAAYKVGVNVLAVEGWLTKAQAAELAGLTSGL